MLVVAAVKAGICLEELCQCRARLQEIPFDSDRKRMTTFHPHEDGCIACIKGAPDVMLNLSNKILKNGEILELTDDDRKKF